MVPGVDNGCPMPMPTELAPFITPGTCPFGVVVRVVSDQGTILSDQHIEVGTGESMLQMIADAACQASLRAIVENPEIAGVMVVGYDGDTGEMMMCVPYDRTDA